MPFSSSNPQQQFAAVEQLLTEWLKERRELLARYTEIVVTVDNAPQGEAFERRQGELCAVLVDYVSAGHFEVFHQLLAEAEVFGDGSNKLAVRLMPVIGDTTEVILAYEEKYGAGDAHLPTLERDLSALGEVLETRFAVEDQLIAGLHNAHRYGADRGQPQTA